MEYIITKEHLRKLIEAANNYDFPLEEIKIVKSIQEWCVENGIEENNPFRTGKCLMNRETKEYKILLAQEITPEMQNSVISLMELRGYGTEIEALKSPSNFLLHLLLHEIAHAKDSNWSEKECDYWAFEQLNEI